MNQNSILVIHPYKYDGQWVFDDDKTGLVREAFIFGADTIIDRLVGSMPNAKDGFTLIFSAYSFPGFQYYFDWVREENGGNWYWSQNYRLEGWLCPALFKYFDVAPKRIYIQTKPKGDLK